MLLEFWPEHLSVPVCVLWPQKKGPSGKCDYTYTAQLQTVKFSVGPHNSLNRASRKENKWNHMWMGKNQYMSFWCNVGGWTGYFRPHFLWKLDIESKMKDIQLEFPGEDRKSRRIDSIPLQYSRKARDFQWPCTVMISRGVPINKRWVAPLMWKLWPGMSGSPATTQTSLQWDMNHVFVISDHLPLEVSKENMSAEVGILALVLHCMWWCRVVRGQDGSLGHAVTDMSAPTCSVTFIHGIWNEANWTPLLAVEI